MPITFEVDEGTQRVMVTATDDFRIEHIVALVTELANRHFLAFAQRFDARGAAMNVNGDAIRRFVPLMARLRDENGQARTAFVADTDVSFGMARMYATLAADVDTGFMVYRTIEEGDAWLGWRPVPTEQQRVF